MSTTVYSSTTVLLYNCVPLYYSVLEGGKIGHLLDRRDERIQPLYISIAADIVVCQAVNRGVQTINQLRLLEG